MWNLIKTTAAVIFIVVLAVWFLATFGWLIIKLFIISLVAALVVALLMVVYVACKSIPNS